MKRLIVFVWVVILAGLVSSPVAASPVHFTFQSGLSFQAGTDWLGLGSNPQVTLTFDLEPPPPDVYFNDGVDAFYHHFGALTLTLSGTSMDGSYSKHPTFPGEMYTWNYLTTEGPNNDLFGINVPFQLPDLPDFLYHCRLYFSQAFWSDSESPAHAKPFAPDDVISFEGVFQTIQGTNIYALTGVTASATASAVPVPPGLILLGSGLLGLAGWGRIRKS